jgi:hypothetical protein
MLRGPNGEKRPADVVGCAVTVMRIATGEIKETGQKCPDKRKGSKAGGSVRAKALLAMAVRNRCTILVERRLSNG